MEKNSVLQDCDPTDGPIAALAQLSTPGASSGPHTRGTRGNSASPTQVSASFRPRVNHKLWHQGFLNLQRDRG